MNKVFIIAEVGVNHNADLDLAYELIDVAMSAGVDAVKFQAAIPELVSTNYAEKAEYQKNSEGESESQLDMIRKLHFQLKTYALLKKYCEDKNIVFFATAFDLISLEYIEKLGQPFHKIPSGEITNLPYLRRIGAYGKPTFLSTGMATLKEIGEALDVLLSAGLPLEKITVLHCNTAYPTPMSDVNLNAMLSIRNQFNVEIGYSDHTVGIEVPIAAVAMGAKVIEKHFTLDKEMVGPDHKASLEPDELKAMVVAIRNIESALGTTDKHASTSETKNINIARRSIVAACDIQKGEMFSDLNLIAKRPGTGISPMQWDDVTGCKSPRNFKQDELIEL